MPLAVLVRFRDGSRLELRYEDGSVHDVSPIVARLLADHVNRPTEPSGQPDGPVADAAKDDAKGAAEGSVEDAVESFLGSLVLTGSSSGLEVTMLDAVSGTGWDVGVADALSLLAAEIRQVAESLGSPDRPAGSDLS